MSTEPIRLDRRHLRRQETIEQVLGHAVDVMAEQGVAGLSLSEVARRMGMRTPSLYGYFDSKSAVYDAVFAWGWSSLRDRMEQAQVSPDDGIRELLHELGARHLRWHVEHPVHAQLMSWRPVPGYVPSEQAYAPAVEVYARGLALFTDLEQRRQLRPGMPAETALRAWTCLLSGVMTQQLANAPDEPYARGRFTALFPDLLDMYLAHYATSQE